MRGMNWMRTCAALAALLSWVLPASAQDYPFFVQPLSVEDLQVIADAVELSPEQRLEMLEAHSDYLDNLESLQSGPMKRFMDQGIGMITVMQPWGGNFSIPPRKELEQIVRDGRAVFSAFGDLDDDFFDSIAPLVSESQLPRMELARTVRALERYRLVYLQLAGEINRGAGIHLIAYLIRNDARISPEMVDVLLEHQERLIAETQGLERAALGVIDDVLDKIDEMGLRDMDQQQMIALAMDESLRDGLIVWADGISRPVQMAISRISAENLRAWRELEPLLEEELADDVRRRVQRRAWGRVCRSLHSLDDRFDRVLDHLDESDPRRPDALDGRERIRSATASLINEYAPIVEKQRRYRTISQFRDDESMEGAQRIESIMERKEQAESQAESLLLVLEADLPHSEQDQQSTQAQVVAGGGGGGGGGDTAAGSVLQVDSGMNNLPLAPISIDQLSELLRWIDAPDTSFAVAEVLHDDYTAQCRTLAQSHATETGDINGEQGGQSWRERRTAQRELNARTIEAMAAHEDTMFGDLSLALEAQEARHRLSAIRVALERSRLRQTMMQSDWSMRSQPEAAIDLTMLVLAQSPQDLTPQDRARVLEQLIDYDQSVEGTLSELESMLDRVQLLESRLNQPGSDGDELDPEVRQRIRRSWEQRRAAVGALASDLVDLNREGSRAISEAMPEGVGGVLMESYRRAAWPDLFRNQETIMSAFEEALAIATLGDEQRRRLQDLRMRHSTTWGALTDELIALRSEGDVRPASWPPSSESLNLALRNEQLRFRRGQVAQRHLAELVVLLEPEQRAMVPSLEDAL